MSFEQERVLVLNGQHLTIEDVHAIAHGGVKVKIAGEAKELLAASRKFVLSLADSDTPVYGFNRGVGLNKDRVVESARYETYNRNLLYSHAAGVQPYASEAQVRAVLAARLNTLLVGRTGLDPAIAERYAEFLNLGIHPLVPLRGSVGVGDITLLSHVGLAFIGEGEVMFGGKRVPAAEALAQTGLEPLCLGPKDGLAIVSSNAVSAGTGALALYDCERLLELADLVYALSLEALQGRVAPLDASLHRYRPYAGQGASAARIRRFLHDSSLWDKESAALQDPLSFRSASHIHGAALDVLAFAKDALHTHLNASDDNPCVIFEEARIVPSANFEPLTWVLGFESLAIALSHLSKSASFRTIRLASPAFTGLSRFLAPDEATIAFGTIQKTFSALDAEIRHLINPSSSDYYALAGDIEDHGSNAPLVVSKVEQITDRLLYILAIEAIHAAQAIDLREAVQLGQGTRTLYKAIREVVPFLDKDRCLTDDIEASYTLLRSHSSRLVGGI
ncbi:histidine ammonia-lyase [Paenibacillus sp. GCM10012307]|uniref:Aromatic amino acid lyase n=1 Tax=Paenibacillus roseus TaxID=2798579 RepID=A0A934MMG6_9BACL|nr:aromatic amino acid ammonia-lyase [Paenibacillus roseus]MBJ6359921.1 aromatic amino acid lyase [Paenibacillus roseus]